MPLFFFHLRTPRGLERDAFGLDRPSLEVAYLEACRTIPDLCVDLLNEGTAPLACAFLICDADGTELIEVPFNEQLNDGRRSGRPNPVPEQLACLAEVRKGRRLVAEMRAQIAEMRASAAEMRATAQLAYPKTEATGPGEV
jgi:hypothetical protein